MAAPPSSQAGPDTPGQNENLVPLLTDDGQPILVTVGNSSDRPAPLPPGGTIVSIPIAEGSYGAGLYGAGPYGGGPVAASPIAVAGTGRAAGTSSATGIGRAVIYFPADIRDEVLTIADDLRSMVPLLRQLIEAQSRLGSNSAASIARLGPDAPRIAELTADVLAEQARLDSPSMSVVEQCLLVGKMLVLAAMEVIAAVVLAIDGNLTYEALTNPPTAQAHALAIATAIERVLLNLF